MKKLFLFFVLVLSFSLLSGCSGTANTEIFNVNEVKINKDNLYLKVGESAELTAQVFPFNAYNQSVYWNSSNKNIASVDENGKVFGKKAGNVEITATSVDGGYNSKCTVDVMENVMKSYMGDKQTQIKNINTASKFKNTYDEEDDSYNPTNLFKKIDEMFQKQQELIEIMIEKMSDKNYLENMEIIDKQEENYTTADGTIVNVKRISYKNK